MAKPVYMIGLDAYDHVLMRRWAEEGLLPNFARLLDTAAHWSLASSTEVLQGSIWPTFATCLDPGHHGMYFVYQLASGSHDLKRVRAHDLKVAPFWSALAPHQRRAVILDVPKVGLTGGENEIQVVEYGAMDRYSAFSTQPANLASSILGRHGEHVLRKSFRKPMTLDQSRQLLDDLCAGARKKAALGNELIEQHAPDLFISVFGESHAAGHHFWPNPERQLLSEAEISPGDALKRVYMELDAIVGEFLERYADRANIFIFSGHGMARDDRPHWIMDEVLVKLGVLARKGPVKNSETVSAAKKPGRPGLLKRIDAGIRHLVKTFAPTALADRMHLMLQQKKNVDFDRSVAWSLPSDHQGFIRINLKGREPHGTVEPNDYDRVVDDLVARLEGLVNVETGNTVVEKVYKVRELYSGAPHLDDLPDLAVAWRNEPVNEIESPGTGRFKVSPAPWGVRPGNHRLEGFCLATGPDIAGTGPRGDADLRDLGATALDLLNVPPAEGIQGVPLVRR